MHLYVRKLLVYLLAAWILLGVTFIVPQPVPAPEGVEVTARGLPLPFYASGTSVFTGPIEAQVSVGLLFADLFVLFVLVAVIHFLYRLLIRKGA